jgi:hypothetical protein
MGAGMKSFVFILALAASSLLTSCSISIPAGTSFLSPVATYTISGTVINLVGTGGGLQLQDNGGDSILVNANGTFTFPAALASGEAYSVTVSVQPSSPAQTCEVTRGTGTATANVSSVTVDCGHKEWTWVNGANIADQTGIYGAEGTPAAGNNPGSRAYASTWTDATGNFWLVGGIGSISPGKRLFADFNDLWEYSAGQWTWWGGSDDQQGTYGTQGNASPSNIPGARYGSASWVDSNGNFWLFGGLGPQLTSAGTPAFLNDLWKYSAGEWTWVDGSGVPNQYGSYGVQGKPAAGNVPGARYGSVTWTDAAGNFWLFGGLGYNATSGVTDLNDLWEYSAGQWTWIGGSNSVFQNGSYGMQGTASPTNVPGARDSAISWTDASGNFWLFGGEGLDSLGNNGYLNDLWKYSDGQWTWMSGSNMANQNGTYGTLGTAAAGNVPGARESSVSWTDPNGSLWLFGGEGYESPTSTGFFSDLWKYSVGQWTWMGGSNAFNQQGSYGSQGEPAPGNVPGARHQAVSWTDAAGNLWIFGGNGYDSAGTLGWLNDLWKYEP